MASCVSCWVVLAVLAAALGAAVGCSLEPPGGAAAGPKAPGDNHFKLIVNGDVERYVPGERYVVTLVGSRTHERVQQFQRFLLVAEPQDPAAPRSTRHQGEFQLFADTLSQFHDECANTVREADDLLKTEVQVMWKAPRAGSGCVNLKAMVMAEDGRWWAADGQLTRPVCEERPRIDCCACDDAKYQMVFEGLWSPQTHPKDFPKALWLTHFSDVIGATHPANFSFWGEGKIATDGFRSLAEWGSVQLLERELRQQGGRLRSIVKAAGLWHPRLNHNTSASFTVDRRRHQLSLASMFGPSPDWVVGVSGLELCRRDCSWEEQLTLDLQPYDAGTDSGISYMSPNAETVPRERMYRITAMYPEDPRAPFYNPGAPDAQVPALARLHVRRTQLLPRACSDDVLQLLAAETHENTQAIDRPECEVEEWGAWSACSVSCGKGLRMRARQYRLPQKAQMLGCDRQLLAKEMCVAATPECPEGEGAAEGSGEDVGEVAEVGAGVCATSEWGPWEECSATCGAGISLRRRHFLQRMGAKKCPTVQTEEVRKCMEAACEAGQQELVDPECPTTEWALWSPCSASCGRGLRIRTRLLMVEPARQQECSTRVELVQQRPCVEQESCQIDMLTAKRICMEEADPGPCRGVYPRWTFMAQKGMCVPFTYFGCRGNRNNFLTQEDCMSTCKVVADALAGGGAASPGGDAPLPAPPGAVARQAQAQAQRSSTSNEVRAKEGAGAGAGAGVGAGADCVVSEWGGWSPCSVSCGVGYQERLRTLISPAGEGGQPCPKRMARRRRCSRGC